MPKSWSPDGRQLLFADVSGTVAGTGTLDIAVIALDANRAPQALIATRAREDTPRISPDGRWLAFETDETGQAEIFVRPFPNLDGGRWRISTEGGLDPIWAADGRTLFYRGRSGHHGGGAARRLAVGVGRAGEALSGSGAVPFRVRPHTSGRLA